MRLFLVLVVSTLGLSACGVGIPRTPNPEQMCAARAQSGARQPGAENQYAALYSQCMLHETGQSPTTIPQPPSTEVYNL